MPELHNARQERFCRFLVSGKSQLEAYEKAVVELTASAQPTEIKERPEEQQKIQKKLRNVKDKATVQLKKEDFRTRMAKTLQNSPRIGN